MINTMVKAPVLPFREAELRSRSRLRLVTSVLRPEQLGAVTEALDRLNLIGGFTVTEDRGSGGATTCYFRGTPYTVRLASDVKIELIVPEERVDEIIALIQTHAQNGNGGEGKFWVTDVSTTSVRIRTGERGMAAF